jgi:hypothetical protein
LREELEGTVVLLSRIGHLSLLGEGHALQRHQPFLPQGETLSGSDEHLEGWSATQDLCD